MTKWFNWYPAGLTVHGVPEMRFEYPSDYPKPSDPRKPKTPKPEPLIPDPEKPEEPDNE